MFFPFNTDAPLYHRPIGTIALIVLNVCVFIATFMPGGLSEDTVESLLLHHDKIAPLQWFTANFFHASLGHLLGNMMFLWVFGLVVEGKLGWWRFLIAYLGIGMAECAVRQTIGYITEDHNFSLGASAGIYGLMMMSLVWAPKNEINFVFVYAFGPAWFFDLQMTVVAGIYVGLDLILAFADGFSLTTPMLHLIGAAVGIIAGVLLLKAHLVDCEGWDIFNVIAGREGEKKSHEPPQESVVADEDDRQKAALSHLRDHLKAGDVANASALHQRMAAKFTSWKLTEPMQQRLIALLLEAKEYDKVRPLLADYIRRFPAQKGPMRLALAEIALNHESRPSQAIAILSHIPPGSLPTELEQRRKVVEREAIVRKNAGELEMQAEE